MQRTFRRLALTGLCGLGCLTAAVPAADAALSVETLPANFITSTSATLHGTVDTGGQPTSWEFQYGPTSSYQAATPFQAIPVGEQSTYVVGTINQLSPNTTYHFRVTAYSGIGANYQEARYGQDLTFTTKPTGRLLLLSRRLPVAGGFVKVRLKCGSQVACQGGFDIVSRSGTKRAKVCAARSFTLRPGKKHSFLAPVRPACLSRLRQRSSHVLVARLAASSTTGQRGVIRMITLVG